MPEAPTQTVALEEVTSRPIRVAQSSITTLFVLVADSLSPEPGRGLSRELRSAIQATLPPKVRSVLAPLVAPYDRYPDCVAPRPAPGARSLDSFLEEIADTPADTLLRELAAEDLADAEEWRPVVRDPRRWLVLYSEALRRAWQAVERPWRDAAEGMERESERVGTAASRDAVPELLAGLVPQAPVRDDVWLLPGDAPRQVGIPDAGLVVIPLLAGPGACLRYYDASARLTHVAYPMPDARRHEPATPPGSQLEALLGRPRALILRALDRPATSGELARVFHAVPSAATHHLAALEGAGLVARHRDGRHVLVHRTARGAALLALFER